MQGKTASQPRPKPRHGQDGAHKAGTSSTMQQDQQQQRRRAVEMTTAIELPRFDVTKPLSQGVIRQGTWLHAGYHMTATIATPAAFSALPWAFAQLTWPGGIVSLLLATAVTYYNSLLLASLNEFDGKRFIRYRDLAQHIYGFGGFVIVTFFQQMVALGNNIAIQIVAGQCGKRIFQMFHPGDNVSLQTFILAFGCFGLFVSQLPDIHSLRYVSLFSTCCTVLFTILNLVFCIVAGNKLDRQNITYSVDETTYWTIYSIFAGLAAISFNFGNPLLPEIQATVERPTNQNMYKSISFCYLIIVVSYYIVALAGYWAFGNTLPTWLPNMYADLVPRGGRMVVELLAIGQLVGIFQLYSRPTQDVFETHLARQDEHPMSRHNWIVRLCVTCMYTILTTTASCMLPFFIDFAALIGALGFTALNFIVPVLLYLKVRNPPRWNYFLNGILIVTYTVVGLLGATGAIRFIAVNADRYKVFADY